MIRHLREAILWVGATLGVLCIAWTVLMFSFGLTPLVFTSGSMSPAIAAGDLGFAKTVDGEDVAVGDVVSVVKNDGVRITHRVVQVDPAQVGVTVTMKGDANREPDAEPYAITDSAERVAFSVPRAGYVVEAVSSPIGMFLGGLLAATALFVAFGRASGPSTPGGTTTEQKPQRQDRDATERSGRLLTVVSGALVVAGAMTAVQPTAASWTDTAVVGSGGISSRTLASVPSVACSGSGGTSVTLRWDDLGPLYEYVVVALDSDGAAYSTQTVRGNGTSATAAIARRTTITYTAYEHRVTVTPRLITSTTWAAPPTVRSVWERYNAVPGLSNRVFCDQP